MFRSIFRLIKDLVRGPARIENRTYWSPIEPPFNKKDPFILGDMWFKSPTGVAHIWHKDKYWKELDI